LERPSSGIDKSMGFFEHRCQEFRLVFDPFHPEASCETRTLWIQIVVVRNNNTIAIAAEAECLSDFARQERRAVL